MIGIPGDVVEVRGGVVLLNGQPRYEPYHRAGVKWRPWPRRPQRRISPAGYPQGSGRASTPASAAQATREPQEAPHQRRPPPQRFEVVSLGCAPPGTPNPNPNPDQVPQRGDPVQPGAGLGPSAQGWLVQLGTGQGHGACALCPTGPPLQSSVRASLAPLYRPWRLPSMPWRHGQRSSLTACCPLPHRAGLGAQQRGLRPRG